MPKYVNVLTKEEVDLDYEPVGEAWAAELDPSLSRRIRREEGGPVPGYWDRFQRPTADAVSQHEKRYGSGTGGALGKVNATSSYPPTAPSLPSIVGLFDGNVCRRCGEVIAPADQQAEWVYLGRDPVTTKALWKKGPPKHREMHEGQDQEESLAAWEADRDWDQESFTRSITPVLPPVKKRRPRRSEAPDLDILDMVARAKRGMKTAAQSEAIVELQRRGRMERVIASTLGVSVKRVRATLP